MKTIKTIIYSTKEPENKQVGFLKQTTDNNFQLFFFGDGGWAPVTNNNNNIKLIYIKDIPDIII